MSIKSWVLHVVNAIMAAARTAQPELTISLILPFF